MVVPHLHRVSAANTDAGLKAMVRRAQEGAYVSAKRSAGGQEDMSMSTEGRSTGAHTGGDRGQERTEGQERGRLGG
jgi:hypothetical protein